MTRVIIALTIVVFLFSPTIARADVVLDWNGIMLTTLTGQSPFAQARFAAITQLAVFEAVNAITRDYNPYLGTIIAPRGASAEAAAISAAHAVLRNYFPGSIQSLDAAWSSSLAAIPNGIPKLQGIQVGQATAAAMIARRAADGSGTPAFYMPTSSDPGQWQLTTSCSPAGGAFLRWRNVTPFGIRTSDQFRSHPPPALISNKYRFDYDEVEEVGRINSIERPPDRTDVARFYAVVSPVAAWNPAARQVATARGSSLSENARTFALLNMAMSDAAVTVFETKYHYNFWRPETAIRAGDTDGNPKTNPDPGFVPLITTPCFPGYPSAHASLSNAARRVLERVFGNRGHSITLSSPALPGVILHYNRLREITDDIDDARIYGGIHFRFDQEAG
ncbi:MAG TPA: vanadium-dependent haloperoxidase, partial [Terriglobia bacterium]|nr:vanadium-dependent haloperoxidase [Terriglobia bacterium]